jgi:hypothetical protein
MGAVGSTVAKIELAGPLVHIGVDYIAIGADASTYKRINPAGTL